MIEAVTLEIVVMNKDALTNIYHPQRICGRFIKFVKILKSKFYLGTERIEWRQQ